MPKLPNFEIAEIKSWQNCELNLTLILASILKMNDSFKCFYFQASYNHYEGCFEMPWEKGYGLNWAGGQSWTSSDQVGLDLCYEELILIFHIAKIALFFTFEVQKMVFHSLDLNPSELETTKNVSKLETLLNDDQVGLHMLPKMILKFIYSEKVTKFCELFT